MELCIIYNFAQKYREGIYKLIDSKYDCHWVFGNNNTDIKGLDEHFLKEVQYIENISLLGPLYYQKGVIPLLRRYDTFIILGELFCVSTWLMLVFRRMFFRSKKLYLWSHGWYGREGLAKRILKKVFFGLADATFLYGHYAKKIALLQGYSKDNLHVIHNSLNYDNQIKIRGALAETSIYKDYFGNDNPVLIFIGRLTKAKRLDLLFEALLLLKTRGKEYNVALVGDGSEKDALQDFATKTQLTSNIWFYGACYDDTKNAELIYNADLCVSPGNVGLTAIHSMVFGTPVLTHDDFKWQGPEFEAIIKNQTGDFFKKDDPCSLAASIEYWFERHQDDRNEIRNHCYKEIDSSWTPEFQLRVIESIIPAI